jgi:hypothetical protein
MKPFKAYGSYKLYEQVYYNNTKIMILMVGWKKREILKNGDAM